MPRVATSTLRSASTAQSWNDRRRAAEFTELDPAVVDLRAGPLKAKVNLPGIKKLLLPRPADTASLDTSVPARALFGPPPETAVAQKRSRLVDFLKQVTLFEDLSRWDLRHLARMSTSATTGTASTSSKKGNPARRSLSCGAAWSRA